MATKKREPAIDDGGITVIQVFQHLGIIPDRSEAWSVGSRCAHQYRNEFGRWPRKENRQKTTGTGSHCFAIYPSAWQSRIASTIKAVCGEAAAMPQLF